LLHQPIALGNSEVVSHRVRIVLRTGPAYRRPVGKTPIDETLAAALRALPRVDVLASRLAPGGAAHALRVEAARVVLDEVRAELRAGGVIPEPGAIEGRAARWIRDRRRPALSRVINATGVIIHTNLGRAPLPRDAVAEVMGYTSLELDLATGARGSRRGAVEPLLLELFEAPTGSAALVVNNNAAAVMLALAAILDPDRREVIVSRGELVEIGGSFRVPDVLATSGATLVEVGTTNKTYAADHRAAIGPRTAALLRVHPSNYRITGFTHRPTTAELVAVAREAGLPLVVDLGSDAPGELPPALVPGAERARDALAAGADLVTFSGDKLLGGPQCGLVLGRAALVLRLAKHPLMRALRPDKLALGALEHVLRAYALGEAGACVPAYIMMRADPDRLRARAERLAAAVPRAMVVATADAIGGGSHPELTLPGFGVAIPQAAADLAATLRAHEPPIIARVHDGALLLALRTVAEDEDAILERALNHVLDTPDTAR